MNRLLALLCLGLFSLTLIACKKKTNNQNTTQVSKNASKAPRRRAAAKDDSKALLALGKAKYTQLCTLCHGPKGYGDGPGAKGLKIKPSAFGKNQWKITGGKLEKILEVLKKGSVKNGMASYAWMPKKERLALAHYILHLSKQ